MASGTEGMIARIKGILLSPKPEWEKIDAEPMTVQGIMTTWVAPLALIPAVARLVGLSLFGMGNILGIELRPSMSYLIANAVVGYVLALAMTFVMALIVDALAPSFGGTKNPVQAMKVVAFSMTASWVGGILTIVPMLGILVLVCGLYGLYLLYLGLPVLMRVPADKAMGYFIVTLVVAVVVSIAIGAVTSAIVMSIAPYPNALMPHMG